MRNIYLISVIQKNLNSLINDKLKFYKLDDLCAPYYMVLLVVSTNNDNLKSQEIANKIGKDKSTVTFLVNKLIKLGYVKKEKSIYDKRVIYVTSTDKLKNISSTLVMIQNEIVEVFNRDMKFESSSKLMGCLHLINDNLLEELGIEEYIHNGRIDCDGEIVKN